jgi:hypothetical protein
MSAVLGPIHLVMFERIGLAALRQSWLRRQVEEQMSPGQRRELDMKLAAGWYEAPAGDLGDLIGGAPIHGWLKEQMERQIFSEAQLLAAVCDRPERRGEVLEILRDHGRRVGEGLLADDPQVAGDARRLLRQVDRILLTSLPCDPVSRVLMDDERATITRRDLLFHQEVWQRAGLDDETALAAQEAWLAGVHEVIPGVRWLRAEVQSEGRRYFDDRVRLDGTA